MKSSSIVSTRTIITILLLFIILLVAILFLTHNRMKTTQASNNNETIIFSIGREIKPFKLITAENQIFTQQNLLNHWTLLVFGFTHCSNVCPVTLAMLANVYPTLSKAYPNLQVILVSLDPERDNQKLLNKYVKKFHHDFIGVSGSIESLRKLQSDLGIYAIRDNSSNNYQIQHSSSILLINPQGKWTGMFKYGLTNKQFHNAFINNLHSLLS